MAGKPRKVMERITDFMIRLKNFVNGAGFQSFEDVINRIESGEIGGRERGQIRTLYRTELETGRPTLRVGPQVAARGDTAPPPPRGTARVEDFPEELLDEREARTGVERSDMGINVRTDGDTNYAQLIVDGRKRYESRDKDSLRPYVGKRVGIVETGAGPARLVGFATVGEPVEVGETEFADARDEHLVPEGSRFDIKPGQSKFLYEMIDPEALAEPVDASGTKGIVARNISKLPGVEQPREARMRVGRPETGVRLRLARRMRSLPRGRSPGISMMP